jgi:hypothetical protein
MTTSETAPLGTFVFRDGVWFFTPAPKQAQK